MSSMKVVKVPIFAAVLLIFLAITMSLILQYRNQSTDIRSKAYEEGPYPTDLIRRSTSRILRSTSESIYETKPTGSISRSTSRILRSTSESIYEPAPTGILRSTSRSVFGP